jgi:hypothetical protein
MTPLNRAPTEEIVPTTIWKSVAAYEAVRGLIVARLLIGPDGWIRASE